MSSNPVHYRRSDAGRSGNTAGEKMKAPENLEPPKAAMTAPNLSGQHAAWSEAAAECARPEPVASGLRRILVALDESEPAEWALDAAIAMASGLRAELGLVHVAEMAPAGTPHSDHGAVAGMDLLCRMASRLPRSLAFTLLTGEGDVGREVVAAARTWNADLIVIGGHARGRLKHLIPLGSAADYVIRHAPCPVTTVARPPNGAATHHAREMARHEELPFRADA